ncbi:MAG TPA: hypothetical protein VK509_12990 [Polyangiales bacterium]|nr:hypothetical protein [Polyangiales bacterium]
MMRARYFALLLAVSAVACQTADQQVGSVCPAGNCSLLAPEELVCLNTSKDSKLDPGFADRCLPEPLMVGKDGLVKCELTLFTLESEQEQTGWLAFSERDQCGTKERPGGFRELACLFPQVLPPNEVGPSEEGWFYVDDEDCPQLRFTSGVPTPEGHATLLCDVALAYQEQELVEVNPARCVEQASESARWVGDRCEPTIIPDGGFHALSDYIEWPHAQCGSGGCLIENLEGDPSMQCSGPNCVDPAAVERHMYCSCRCDSLNEEDRRPLCDCPSGYACVAASATAGYCWRMERP